MLVHLVPNLPWCFFFAAGHGVQEHFKNNIFVRRSSHFGPFVAKLALVVMFRHPGTVTQNPIKNNLFLVRRSSNFGQVGAKLALLEIFGTSQKQPFRKVFTPFWPIGLGNNFSASQYGVTVSQNPSKFVPNWPVEIVRHPGTVSQNPA